MLKRNIVGKIYSFVLKRYRDEKPDVVLTKEMRDMIWFSIYGEVERNGEEAAWKYAKTAKLIG